MVIGILIAIYLVSAIIVRNFVIDDWKSGIEPKIILLMLILLPVINTGCIAIAINASRDEILEAGINMIKQAFNSLKRICIVRKVRQWIYGKGEPDVLPNYTTAYQRELERLRSKYKQYPKQHSGQSNHKPDTSSTTSYRTTGRFDFTNRRDTK